MNLRNQFWREKSKDTSFINDIKKYPELKKLIRYDKNFNNKRKVSFESALAGIIRKNPRFLYPTIKKLTSSILPDFIDAFNNQDSTWLKQHFFDFFAQNPDIHAEYTGTYEEKISSTSKERTAFIKWILDILSSQNEKDAYKQLLIIREYGNYFLRPYVHMPEFKNLNEGLGVLIVPEGVGNEASKPIMRELWRKCNFEFRHSDIAHSRVSTKDLPRAKLINDFGIFDEDAEFGEVKEMIPHKIAHHLPGKNLWRVTATSAFTQHARYQLDMPLITSQGCSIALLLIPAMVVGKLTKEEMRYFNINAISYMTGNGHHSLHEFSAAWEALGIPYIHGDYSSLFPEYLLRKHPELSELQEKFPDFLPPNIQKFIYTKSINARTDEQKKTLRAKL